MTGPRLVRPLKGARLKAPCWWCSRALRGGRGAIGIVDGNAVAFHGECLREALRDSDMAGRLRAKSLDALSSSRRATKGAE